MPAEGSVADLGSGPDGVDVFRRSGLAIGNSSSETKKLWKITQHECYGNRLKEEV
jgi:hypothetical protein